MLRHVVGDDGYVLAQVPLGRLLYFPGNNDSNPGRGFWWNKMSRRSVDFVICDPRSLAPIVAIELDEPSHTEPARQTRDDEVETMLDAAGLVLLRVLASRNYDTRELADVILPLLRRRL